MYPQYNNNMIKKRKKSSLKFIWKHKRQRIAEEMLIKKSDSEGITLPSFKPFSRATAIKTACAEHQWNSIEDPM
jgi:hypothetical protein